MERTTATLKDWLESLRQQAERGRVVSVSAGGGENRDYSYLHYRTNDGQHSVLVFRSAPEYGHDVYTFRVDGDQQDIAALVDRATHGPVLPM